jgi:hypothetical protein
LPCRHVGAYIAGMSETKPVPPGVPAPEPPAASTPPATKLPPEIGGPQGPEPTRYGDWERKGRCIDF